MLTCVDADPTVLVRKETQSRKILESGDGDSCPPQLLHGCSQTVVKSHLVSVACPAPRSCKSILKYPQILEFKF